MIDAIEIINFQGHKYTLLELDPGVNIIKGTSDNGKSSIIRGCKWFITNKQPRSTDFKNWDAKENDEVSIAMQFRQDDFICRKKDNNFNGYVLNNETFEALRTDVPDEIRLVAKMTEANVRSQDDSYFLLSESPGAVARKLNDILGLNSIAEATSKANSLINEYKSELKFSKKELKEAQENLKECAWVDSAYEDLQKVIQLEKDIKECHDFKDGLQLQLSFINSTKNKIDINDSIVELEPDVDKAIDLYEQSVEAKEECESLNDLIDAILYTTDDLYNVSDLIELETDVDNVLNLSQKHTEIDGVKKNIAEHISRVNHTQKALDKLSQSLERSSKALLDMQKEITECPTCGSDKKHWTNKELL